MAKHHNPFRVFRRNQKAWMAALTLFTMFSFIALGSMVQCIGAKNEVTGPRYTDVVATTQKFGKLDYNNFLRVRQDLTILGAFLDALAQAAQAYQAQPSDALTSLRMETNLAASDAEVLVDRWLVTKFAQKEKLYPGEGAVLEYLRSLTQVIQYNENNEPNVGSIPADAIATAMRSVGLNEPGLRDLLSAQIAYERLIRRVDAGRRMDPWYNQIGIAQIGFGHGELLSSPGDALVAFDALNRMAKAKVAVFKASAFVDQIDDPSDLVARQFYEQYKNMTFHADSETPGFTQPNKMALEIVRADIDDEALDAISMDDVQQYYEEHKEEFRIPRASDSAADSATDPAAEAVTLPDVDVPTLDAFPDSALDIFGTEETDPLEEAAPVEATDSVEDAAPSEETAPVEEATPSEETDPTEEAANYMTSEALIAYQQEAEDEESAVDAPVDEDVAVDEEPAVDAPVDEDVAVDEEPAVDAPVDEDVAVDEEPAVDAPVDEDVAVDEEPAVDAPVDEDVAVDEEPAVDAPVDEDVAVDAPVDEDIPVDEDPAVDVPVEDVLTDLDLDSEYLALEDVERFIRTRIAAERIEAKMAELTEQLQNYYRETITDSDGGGAGTVDMKAYAETNGLKYLATAPNGEDVDSALLISQDEAVIMDLLPADTLQEIFESMPLVNAPRRIGVYAPETNPMQKFNPPTAYYVFRAVETKAANTPEYEDIQDLVAETWKLRKASKLASDAAQEFAEKAKADGADFDKLAAEASVPVVETERFSWFKSSIQSYAQPSEIREAGVEVGEADRENKEIVAPGWAFYETVFGLEQDEVGYCENQPKDRSFVVKVVEKDEPDTEGLDQISSDPSVAYVMMWIRRSRLEKFHADFIRGLRDQAGFEWVWIPRVEDR
ncbi:MAG: hypothetical protein ACOX0A_00670 [Thermoguttaceae bacterium]|jgi:hypothetical protein